MAEQVELRHPDSERTLTVSRPAVRQYRKQGWVPAAEFDPPKPKRTRRRRRVEPIPEPVAVEPAGEPEQFTEEWFEAKASESDADTVAPSPDEFVIPRDRFDAAMAEAERRAADLTD